MCIEISRDYGREKRTGECNATNNFEDFAAIINYNNLC